MSESKHKIIEILRILKEVEKPVGAKIIADELNKKGYNLGERAVRYHMQILDKKGFTEKLGYSGRKITSLGLNELNKGLAYDKVDFIFSKFEEKIYQTSLKGNGNSFNSATGNIIVNESKIILNNINSEVHINNKNNSDNSNNNNTNGNSYEDKRRKITKETIKIMKNVINSGYTVSPLVDIVKIDEEWNNSNNIENSENYNENSAKTVLNIKTVCGTTIDGVLLNNGIATNPIYGGLIKVIDNIPSHFTQLISYKKTSLTPLDAFIAENMTSVLKASETGTGIIPGNLRLIPAAGRDDTIEILDNLEKIGIGGLLEIGKPGESILGLPVQDDMVGIAIIGGISPLCAVQEAGYNANELGEKILDFNELLNINHINDTYSSNNANSPNNINTENNKNDFDKAIESVINPFNSKFANKFTNKNNNFKSPEVKRVQFLLTKAWNLIHNVNFNISTGQGNLIANISYLNKDDLDRTIEIMAETYKTHQNYVNPYYKIVNHPNDNNIKGIATICSFSIDGILIKNGIMSTPKYGGLLKTGANPCFIELISYNGSSLDPHEIFIFKNMTSISPNSTTINTPTIDTKSRSEKNNHILASLKEVPFITRSNAISILDKIKEMRISNYKAGKPRELIYNAIVDNYNFGIVTPSGLNPIAAAKESGIDLKVKTVTDTIEFKTMEKY